jgi:hypothetical protein
MKKSQAKLTTEPVRAGDTGGMEPEFARLPDIQRLFGIKRGTAYNLLAAGKIKGVSLREPGQRHGCRLVHVASVRAFLNSKLEGVA